MGGCFRDGVKTPHMAKDESEAVIHAIAVSHLHRRRVRLSRSRISDRWAQQTDRPLACFTEISVARVVALNAGRVAEESTGHIRWLRPDYQLPRFGKA